MSFQRPDIIRPPSERRSYYLPLTGGCSNNACAFCTFYGSKLRIRDVEDVKREIDALAFYLKNDIRLPNIHSIVYQIGEQWDGQRIFLQDGDALVYPYPKLKEILEHITLKLPSVERVGSYATTQDILRLSVPELKALKNLNLGILYMGVESGDEELLRAWSKGATTDEMVLAGDKLKDAGIGFSISLILGLGGVHGSSRHAAETARILNRLDPDYAGALTLTLVPGTPLYTECQKGTFLPISPFESLKELKTIIEGSELTGCIFTSMHASNYFSVRGTLPIDKSRMINELDSVIRKGDPNSLRPEFLRGL